MIQGKREARRQGAIGQYTCTACGRLYSAKNERCNCGRWGTIEAISSQGGAARALGAIDGGGASRLTTYNEEVDRVLGGGVVLGSQIILSGEPAAGKSTLTMQICLDLAEADPVLYVCGEESAPQVKARAVRLLLERHDRQEIFRNLHLTRNVEIKAIEEDIAKVNPILVVIDSLFSITPERDVMGGAALTDAAKGLTRVSKATNIPFLIIGHVTKEETLSAPRTVEHMVDVALHLEGDRREQLRYLRANKNRFGSTEEVGFFQMTEQGLIRADIGADLDARNEKQTACLCVVSEGTRSFVHEIQASVGAETGRIHARGLKADRVAMLASLIQSHLKIAVNRELFVSCGGGFRVDDPLADMAICAAILSSAIGAPLPSDWLAIGELTPTGRFEARGIDRRVAFAKQRFTSLLRRPRILTPSDCPNLSALLEAIAEERE